MLRNRLREQRKHQKRDMFPHTITIYNSVESLDDYFRPLGVVNHMTILRGVFVDAEKAANVLQSGLVSADSVSVIIPEDVEAVDGLTGVKKRYIGPKEWSRATEEEREDVWTMTLDGEGEGDSFFILGEVVEPDMSLEDISNRYDGVYNITKVDDKRHGGIPHWEVGGA